MTLKVNPEDWNLLPKEQQDKTKEIIAGFFKGQSIELDPGAPRLPRVADEQANFSWCTTACDLIEAAAILACEGEPICTLVAKAAGKICRDEC
jgi:hypothetical protein